MNTSKHFKKVSAIVVTFNGEPWIQSCLQSLKNSIYPVEIIVIDNGSTDKTTSIIESHFPDVKLLINDNNLGFGQANNVGICYAMGNGSEFVFLLNQDATIEDNAIKNLVDAFAESPSYSLLSPVHYNGSGNDFDSGFKRYALERYNSIADIETWKSGKGNVYQANFVNAAAWMINMDVIKKIGGFAPLFFHYGEDRDFVNRLSYFNLKLGILPSAKIYHFREQRNMDIANWNYSKKLKYYYVGFLMRAADVNRSLTKGFLKGFIWCFKESIVLTLKGVLYAPLIFIDIFFKMLWSIPGIIGHRKFARAPLAYQFLPCV
jgi:GT2 family glycosyltransferase